MADNQTIEEVYSVSKSVLENFVKSAMCYEYLYAQNVKQNNPNVAFLQDMETLAINTLKQFSIPENQQDLEQIMATFSERVTEHLRALKK